MGCCKGFLREEKGGFYDGEEYWDRCGNLATYRTTEMMVMTVEYNACA